MDAIEKRARELLAAEIERDGFTHAAEWMRDPNKSLRHIEAEAIRAIIAALTRPEGYVLVPVELPVEMEVAFMEAWVSKRRCIDDPEMQDAWEAALVARPDHIAHDLKMVGARPEVP